MIENLTSKVDSKAEREHNILNRDIDNPGQEIILPSARAEEIESVTRPEGHYNEHYPFMTISTQKITFNNEMNIYYWNPLKQNKYKSKFENLII